MKTATWIDQETLRIEIDGPAAGKYDFKNPSPREGLLEYGKIKLADGKEVNLKIKICDIIGLESEIKLCAEAARVARIERIESAAPGYHVLREKMNILSREDYFFSKIMESGASIFPPRTISEEEVQSFAKAHPRAALLIRAENQENAANWAKSKAGAEARELILSGGSEEAARDLLGNWMKNNGVEVD